MPTKLFVFATPKEAKAFWQTHIDFVQGQPVQVKDQTWSLVTGISLLNAVFLSAVLQKIKVDLVINLGIAGAFDLDQFNLGSIVICKQEIWPELGVWTEQGVENELLNFNLFRNKELCLTNQLTLEPQKILDQFGLKFNYPLVKSISVAGVSGTWQQRSLLAQRYKPDIENMEGFGLAYVCKLFKISFLEIRTISNLVGSRKQKDWDIPLALNQLQLVAAKFNL